MIEIKKLNINHTEDENGNIIISAKDAIENAGLIWGEEKESKEHPDTDCDS